MRLNKKNSVPLSTELMSLLLGFYVDVKCINWTLAYGFFSSEVGFMSLLYPAVVICILLLFLCSPIKQHVKASKKSYLIALYLILFYIFTIAFIGQPRVSIPFFALFTITGLLLPNISQINCRIFLISVMLWPCIAILKIDSVFQMVVDWKDAISMDASYAFMTPVIATIVYFYFYYHKDRKSEKIFTTVLMIINFIFFLKLFQYGSRGPLLAIFLTIAFLWAVRYSKVKGGAAFNNNRMILAIFLLLILGLFTDALLELIVSLFDKMGINSVAFEKIARLSSEGDISNGRNDLKALAIRGFSEHILFGNGFDRFDANTGQAYPHNFILQILYDGGLLLAFILLLPIIIITFRKFKRCTKDEYIVQIFLLFSSVPYALFSQDLWENAVFWLYVGFIFSNTFVYRRNDYEI